MLGPDLNWIFFIVLRRKARRNLWRCGIEGDTYGNQFPALAPVYSLMYAVTMALVAPG